MADINKNINKTTIIFTSIMVLAIVGLVTIIIFGNLQGNLGFSQDTMLISNETILFTDGGYTPNGTSGFQNLGTFTSVIITNESDPEQVPATNYTLSAGGIVTAVGSSPWNGTEVNFTGTILKDSVSQADSDNVIYNITTGTSDFFDFATTWFTLLGVALLVIIAFALVGVVQSRGGQGDKVANEGSKFAS